MLDVASRQWMSKSEIFDLFDRRQRSFSWLMVFFVTLLIQLSYGVTEFIYDSGVYWGLSKSASLSNFPDVLRGYVFPALLYPIHFLTDFADDTNKLIFKVVTSALYAFLLTGPMFDFFKKVFSGRESVIRRTGGALLLFALYPGLFFYPLSDLPAAMAIVLGVHLVDSSKRKYWPVFVSLSGVLFYAAYNIRTVYVFSFVIVVVLIPLFFYKHETIKTRFLAVLLFLCGALCVAAPQMIINKRIHNTASPMVFANISDRSLMASQLFWGITIQRYETYAGVDSPSASQFYCDPAGIALRKANPKVFAKVPTIASYMKFALANPASFMGIYSRHFINGIDVGDGVVYVKSMSAKRNVSSVLCFTLFLLSLFIFIARQNFRIQELVYLAPILLPVLAILPGAIETRFFMPLYLVLIGALATNFSIITIKNALQLYWARAILLYLLFLGLFLAVSTETISNLMYTMP